MVLNKDGGSGWSLGFPDRDSLDNLRQSIRLKSWITSSSNMSLASTTSSDSIPSKDVLSILFILVPEMRRWETLGADGTVSILL